MKNNFSKIFFKLFSIALISVLFAACSKTNNPVDSNSSTNEPVVTKYTSPTKGWQNISSTNGVTSIGKALSPTPGGGGWMTSYAQVNVGILEHPIVTTYLENDHEGAPGNYRVSTNFQWKGSIAGNGIAGAGAAVSISMEIRDNTGNLITTYDIHDKEVKNSNLQVGGITDDGSKDIAVDFNLPEGKTGFKIIFKMKVEAWSGIFGALCQSHFWDREYLDRGAGWTSLTVTQLNN